MLAKIGMSLMLFTIASGADAVNLKQDEVGYHCESINGPRTELQLNAEDTQATLKTADTILRFKDIEFLDSAVLMESDASGLVFQVREDGSSFLIEGKLYDFSERQCFDQGFSKACSLSDLKSLYWSPELLELRDGPTTEISAPVRRYGIYPNDGTYFSASNELKQAIHIVDFGSSLYLVVGQKTELNCIEDSSL